MEIDMVIGTRRGTTTAVRTAARTVVTNVEMNVLKDVRRDAMIVEKTDVTSDESMTKVVVTLLSVNTRAVARQHRRVTMTPPRTTTDALAGTFAWLCQSQFLFSSFHFCRIFVFAVPFVIVKTATEQLPTLILVIAPRPRRLVVGLVRRVPSFSI
jgi:hypothetical protein